MTGHAPWQELAAGQSLAALEPEDEQVFLAHLRACDLCARTLREMRALSAQLAFAAEPVPPPRALRAGLAAHVASTGGRSVLNRRSVGPRGEGASRFAVLATPRGERWLAAAGAVVLVLALASWNLVLRTQVGTTAAALRRSHAAVDALAGPGSTTARLTGPTGAYATVVVRGGRAWIVVAGLSRSTRDRVYVLWAAPESGGLRALRPFEVVNHGVNVIDFGEVDLTLAATRGFAVSREPRGVEPTMPSERLLTGDIDG